MSDKYPKVLQVHLTEGQHEALRESAYRSRLSMVEVVRGLIDGLGGVEVGLPKPSPVAQKQPQEPPVRLTDVMQSVTRKAGPGHVFGTPVADEEVPMNRCFGCKEKVEKWTLGKDGRPWCDECIENQRGEIP